MDPIHLHPMDFGILCHGRRPQCKDYRIDPAKELGRGGFRFSFSDYYPQNPEIRFAEIDGKYNHAPLLLKNYFQIQMRIWVGELDISLIKDTRTEKDLTVDDIPEAVMDLLDMMSVFISSAPDPSQRRYYTNNGSYFERSGDYHFMITKTP